MSKFTLRADVGAWPRFGDYAVVEQKRHGAPNEMFYHKVVATLHSNSWVDVPVQSPPTATLHDTTEPVAIVICCGVSESNTYRVRVADLHKVEVSGRPGEAMSGWQPIASAPMDGTEVLLASTGQKFDGVPIPDRVTLGHYTVGGELLKHVGDCGGVCRCPEYEDVEPFWMSWDGGFTEENPPTHWQPLPSAPTE